MACAIHGAFPLTGLPAIYISEMSGQDLWEEVDVAPGNPPGLNYGWNYREGMHPYAGSPPASLKLYYPVAEYSHSWAAVR